MTTISREELKLHGPDSTEPWVVIGTKVYNVSKFHKLHPGGSKVLVDRCGGSTDAVTRATEDFNIAHPPSLLARSRYQRLLVGTIDLRDGSWSKKEKKALGYKIPATAEYGGAPARMCDHYWMEPTFSSPFFSEKHRALVKLLRAFYAKEVVPNIGKWDEAGKYPKGIIPKLYKAGVYGMPWPEQYGGTGIPGNLGLQWDPFTAMIMYYESSRVGSGGFQASTGSIAIALPPILAHGTAELKEKYARPLIEGTALGALCITEPWGGSDVSRLRCTAVTASDDPSILVVNGEKKFITTGMEADFLTVAVRTKPASESKNTFDGISLLIIEAKSPGVDRMRMKTQGWWASNTAYITFEDVRVPKSNILGTMHEGFKYIMNNFNNERFMMVCHCAAVSHRLIAESIRFASVRKTFGQPLIKHQVIRHKLAEMSMRTEGVYAQAEQLAYLMSQKVPHIDIGPKIALTKSLATKCYELCAREASQIYGGNAYQRGGQGELVERMYRDVRVQAIGGGSEEIMQDLGVRMSKL